jgi:site-specific recombinase XerD
LAQASTESLEFTIEAARNSFRRHLRAANKSPRTIQSYTEAVQRFNRFLAEQGMPRSVRGIRREHIEAWLVALQEAGQRPATVANRYRSLRVFFGWLVEDDEAGIPKLYVHQLRHLDAHNAHQEGMSETDIMHRFGWRTRDMLRRYASSTSAERAQEHARQLRGGDRY